MPECDFHPGVETSVRCASCDRYMCPADMVETPVGMKCRECAAPPKTTRPRGKPVQYAGAAGAAIAAGLVGGLLVGQALAAIPLLGFLRWWLWLLFGAAVGEATRRGAQGNRGVGFAAIAGVGSIIGVLVNPMLGLRFLDPVSLAFAAAGAVLYVLSGRL